MISHRTSWLIGLEYCLGVLLGIFQICFLVSSHLVGFWVSLRAMFRLRALQALEKKQKKPQFSHVSFLF